MILQIRLLWSRICLLRHTFLSDVPREFLTAEKYSHSWFIDDTAYRIKYIDVLGRTWSKAWGIKKPEIPTYTLRKNRVWINKLGGMSWNKKGKFFVCVCRDEE